MAETIEATLERLRKTGKVPLGILSYNVDKEGLHISLFSDIYREEALALFRKHEFTIVFEKSNP